MRPRARLGLALALCLAALAPRAEASPERVVSMNLCTDQLAMLIAEPGQIRAVTWVSRDPVSSALWREAEALPVHNGQAEDIQGFDPDLVLAGEYDPPATLSLLRRLGLRVEVFALEQSFADVRRNVTRMGALLGQPARARTLIAAMDESLAPEPRTAPEPRAALYYANGYTSGAGTLADEIVTRAGFGNIAAENGYGGLVHLPLETLVMEAPDLLVTGQDYATPALAQGILRHPALAALGPERTEIADNLWVCGTPLAARAVSALRAARHP